MNLQDIRAAVRNYLDTKVSVSLSMVKPEKGSTVQPNEIFFSV